MTTATAPSAHMASRIDAKNAPDYFPTPPWATRALCEELLELEQGGDELSVWEPACGEGHMATPLAEYFSHVFASDLFNRGFNDNHGSGWDFLHLDPAAQFPAGYFDWIITNPPYGDNAQLFVERAFEHQPRQGVAVFVQLRWLETINRGIELFLPFRPHMIGVFCERVPLVKNRYDPEAGTATAYIWVIWRTDITASDAITRWIPPGAAKRHFRARDLLLANTTKPEVSGEALPLFDREASA